MGLSIYFFFGLGCLVSFLLGYQVCKGKLDEARAGNYAGMKRELSMRADLNTAHQRIASLRTEVRMLRGLSTDGN